MQHKTPWRTTALASLGAGLEYCDFVIYLLLARYLAAAFFPNHSPWAVRLQPLGLFAAGYIARPLGGLVFGSRGDRCGRKSTFLRTTGLMAAATFAIGCLPTHAQLGLWATCLLVGLRCVQGFSMGGELPGAITFVAEHAAPAQRGRACGVVIAGITAGGIGAAGLLALLTAALDEASMTAWGWRLPFWIAGSSAFVAQNARRSMPETPQFAAVERTPLRRLFAQHRAALGWGFWVACLGTSAVIFPLYAPLYLHRLGFAMADIYRCTTLSLVWGVLASLGFGLAVDRVGAHRLLQGAAGIWALGVPAAVALLQMVHPAALLAFCLVWQTGTAAAVTAYWVVLAGAFPVRVRYSALAVCINGAFACGGLLPMLLEILVRRLGPGAVAYPFVALATLGGLGAWRLRRAAARMEPARSMEMAAAPEPL